MIPGNRTESPDPKQTNRTRSRYQRISPIYDFMEILPEKRYLPWRQNLWSMVTGPKVLEVGVGTGKNMGFYPKDAQVTAIDLTPGMLKRAKKRAASLDSNVELILGDVQVLDYPDASFDSVVATFVFCSVPNPVLGLSELYRVVKPGGQVLLLEHVRSGNAILGFLMDLLNPFIVRLTGANINRKTISNVRLAGFNIKNDEHLGLGDIFRMMIANTESIKEKL